MKVLGSAVLAMEVMVMGFAVLLASKNESGGLLILGGVIAFLLIIAAGMLRKRSGWILGSILQVAMIAFGFVVTPLFFLGALFGGLWVAAIVVGRKGEAARAALLKAGKSTGHKSQ
ncbi:MAG: DUF4233 domain-containing protein [Candidatus Nanopelagicaceae bacterium]|nr:DUF4233 domain-containing protein [Candidatus Nanopelagicaceae bacterium]